MSLQFVLGSSGSGKTEYMYQKIVQEAQKQPRQNFLVIVPEQFTMQTQRKLVDLSANGAIMNIDVLSFKRLAYRVFDELGVCELEILEETGKNLVLRKLAQDKKENLTVLRPNLGKIGYISELKSLLSEFVQYNITPDKLREYIDKEDLPSAFAEKLADVVVMYEAFESFMKNRYIMAEELLQVLSNVADQSLILQNSVFVLDEFTGFTPIQKQLLYKLFPIADKIWVSLTIGAEEDFYHSKGMQELFDMSKKTIGSLMEMAERLKIDVLEPIVLEENEKKRYVNAPALSFMEKNLFRLKSSSMEQETGEIQIISVKSPRDEMIYVARTINDLIQKKGYRYRDIAVVSGAVEIYANYVQSVFGKYHIPYFIDATKEILFHPFIEWIRAALEIVHTDFSYESVFRFLRCGFCDLADTQIDMLENYILATGIRGQKKWKKKWFCLQKERTGEQEETQGYIPKGMRKEQLEELETTRRYLWGLLEPFISVFQTKDVCVSQEINAIYELTCSMEIEEQLWEKEKEYTGCGEQVKAKEYGQIYRIVMELFDKYVNLLGEEHLSIQEFIEILDAGLDAAEVAAIPPGYDCVTIGDIERTRLSQIKILFFIGVNDGIIPKSANQGGIISQYERELLKERDLELAPGAREQSFIQRFYLYLNLTKPSDFLFVCYTRVDSEGKAVRQSYLIAVLQRMFPKMKHRELGELRKTLDISTMEAAKEYLVHGEKDAKWLSLAKWFARKEEGYVLKQLFEASYIHYTDEPISRAVAQAIYGTKTKGSVTRFEQFARCAYAHFLKYGLLLGERQTSGFANVDVGNIYHDALLQYSMKVVDAKEDWFTISEERRREFSDQAFLEVVETYHNPGIYATAENVHMIERMKHIFGQTVWALTEQVRKGRFVPEWFEVSFGNEDASDVLHFRFENKESIGLAGRIDRVDICSQNEDGRIYIKIIDYKSGNTKFDLLKLYQGTQLQLIIYMNAALEQTEKQYAENQYTEKQYVKKTIVPGGILYYHIDDPVIEVTDEISGEQAEQMILEQLKPDGFVNGEEVIYRAMDAGFEQKSDVIPVAIKKNGELSTLSHTLSTEEFEIIGEFAQNQIQTLGQEMFDGKISINPLNDAGGGSCAYCPYETICQIYARIPGMETRNVMKGKKEEILEKMRTINAAQSHKIL